MQAGASNLGLNLITLATLPSSSFSLSLAMNMLAGHSGTTNSPLAPQDSADLSTLATNPTGGWKNPFHQVPQSALNASTPVAPAKSNRVDAFRGEGVGGKTVKVLNGRGEYFQPKIVQHVFYQQ